MKFDHSKEVRRLQKEVSVAEQARRELEFEMMSRKGPGKGNDVLESGR
jgi:hypothetical protein